jgi:hypothetical protein
MVLLWGNGSSTETQLSAVLAKISISQMPHTKSKKDANPSEKSQKMPSSKRPILLSSVSVSAIGLFELG